MTRFDVIDDYLQSFAEAATELGIPVCVTVGSGPQGNTTAELTRALVLLLIRYGPRRAMSHTAHSKSYSPALNCCRLTCFFRSRAAGWWRRWRPCALLIVTNKAVLDRHRT